MSLGLAGVGLPHLGCGLVRLFRVFRPLAFAMLNKEMNAVVALCAWLGFVFTD